MKFEDADSYRTRSTYTYTLAEALEATFESRPHRQRNALALVVEKLHAAGLISDEDIKNLAYDDFRAISD